MRPAASEDPRAGRPAIGYLTAAEVAQALRVSKQVTGAGVGTPTEYLTAEEVARMLRVSLKTAYERLRLGEIPSIRVGKQWRIPANALTPKQPGLFG